MCCYENIFLFHLKVLCYLQSQKIWVATSHFVITVTFCNTMAHFVIKSVALCNNNLPHFVIKLLYWFLQFEICQKKPTKFSCPLCNKIIISIYLPAFLPTLITSWLPRSPYLAGWCFQVKDHLQQSHVTFWSRGQVRSHDKWEKLHFHFHEAYGY